MPETQNTLALLREDLSTVLEAAGVRTHGFLPERIVPPLALLAAGSPYVEDGDTYGSYTVRFTVVLVASQATNQVATKELDEAVTAALVALDNGNWAIERVDQPTMMQSSNTHYLSTTIDVLRKVTGMDDGRP